MDTNPSAALEELDRRKRAAESEPGDTGAEMAVWQAAAQLPVWFLVNRGTADHPQPSGFELDGVGVLIGIYSTVERAGAVAGERGSVIGVPLPAALDWLASFAAQQVAGVVLDSPGPWTPLANLRFFHEWVPKRSADPDPDPDPCASRLQAAMDAYVADQTDDSYLAAVREIADAELFVVLDPQVSGGVPTSIVNPRGERVLLAFTDLARLEAMYGGKAVEVSPRGGADIARLVGAGFDVLILDPQHPASFAVTPEWIGRAGGDARGRS